MAELNAGDQIPELRVTPDKYLPHRYAGASGDFNPIHIDPEFAKAVGLPNTILHGLYMMGLVARANTDAAGGDPRALKRLSVQFRGMGAPETEIVVTGTVKSVDGDTVVIDTVAAQGENQTIRNAEAEVAAARRARSSLPRNILHGLYSMGLVARPTRARRRRLRALKRLSVQMRGMGVPSRRSSSPARSNRRWQPGRRRHRRRSGRDG